MGTEHQARMVKGSEVEVCSEEEGFKGAYFRALLEENLTQSGRKKVSVRYKTLLSHDGSSPLTETVQQSLLRPVPPPSVGVFLEEGTVVDAYLRDGWWKGFIIKKMEEEDDHDNYLVYFDSPPDIIMFDNTKLRAHVDWTDSKWFRPDLKELDKSMFCPGTMVEVSSVIDKREAAWFPAMLIKESEEEDGEKKFIVKDCNQHLSSYGEEARPNTTVDPRRVRPKPPPPPSSVKYKLMDCVEVFLGSVWRQGWVRVLLTGQCYEVCLEATKEKHVFTHSHVRPLKVWEDGAWDDNNRSKEETPSRGIMKPKAVSSKRGRKHVRGGGGSLGPARSGETLTKAETVTAVTGEVSNKKADAVVMTGETSPPVISTPQVTPIAKESASVVTPSPPVIAATPLKQTGTETEGQQSSEKTPEPRSKQNGLVNDSTQHKIPEEEEEETSQDKSRKRKRGEEQQSDGSCNGSSKDKCSNESDVDCQPISSAIEISSSSSSHQTPNVNHVMMKSAATSNVEETPPPAALMALPFAKRSPYWEGCEATEGYKSMPQHPHFSPLLEAKDNIRELLAVGMMASFYSLLDKVKALKPHDSLSLLWSLSDSLVDLEQYGFEVDAPQSRIRKMMSLKDEQAKKAEEKECLEKKVDEDEKKSRELGEEMDELKRREAVAKEEKEAAEKRIVEMKASGVRVEQEIEDVELEFLKTASAPW